MKDYKVISNFYDLLQKKEYKVGDTYDASKSTKERIKSLTTTKNKHATKFIKEVKS